MKNLLAVSIGVIVSILIGSLFMKVSSKPEAAEFVSGSNEIKAFQVAAFNTEDAALKEASNKNGIVIKDNNYYCVYVAILKEQENINKMVSYLNDTNTYYYIKNIELDEYISTELIKYEELMKKTTSNVAFLRLNEQILKFVGENNEN